MLKLKHLGIQILILTIAFSAGSCLKDIRTPYMKNNSESRLAKNQYAQDILKKAANLAGAEQLKQFDAYTVDFEDQFYGFMGKFAAPYKESKIALKLHYNPNSFDGHVIFKSGKEKGKVWGLENWKSYQIDKNHQKVFKEDKKAKFWVPTYQYFIELPFKIQSAQVVSYAGLKQYNGKSYDLVFASWDSEEPRKDLDQYILWINQETGLIDIVQFTVREQYRFISAYGLYEDFKNIGGVSFPGSITIKNDIDDKKPMHKMTLHSIHPIY